MLKLKLTKQVQKFLGNLPAKQKRQLKEKIQALQNNPKPPDSKILKGYSYLRADAGEYRIIYQIGKDETLLIFLIAKRNDNEVYKQLRRKVF